jgi:aryl-phospho-beta-D-glucosidase BglC (GH1 family)
MVDGQIIGQGGPSNDVFAALWSSIATKYADNSNVLFGLMNEPHDSMAMTPQKPTKANTLQYQISMLGLLLVKQPSMPL